MKTEHIPRGIQSGLLLFITLLACLSERVSGQAGLPILPGQIVVTCFSGTSNNAVIPDPNNHVVGIIDTRDPLANGASLGSNWFPPAGFMFHNEGSPDEWFASRLGEVFGVTLDGTSTPNIFLTATTIYGNFPPGPAGHGGVYRLDGDTGAITSMSIPATGNASLGNICYHRSNNGDQSLYVSSLEDGMIYRINAVTLALAGPSYDHGVAGRAAATLPPIPDPGTPDTLSPLGRRVWGVQAHQGRLYYGVWWEDRVNPSPTRENEVWSVALDSTTGNFLPATAQLEVSLPSRLGKNWSLPVASIDFTLSGALLVAERYYRWDGVHEARVLEYTGGSGSWTASPIDKYRVGNGRILAAGGVASDCEENVWATGDILNGNIYGLHRIPAGGNAADSPATANSLLIDIDEDLVAQDKTLIGAVDIYNDCNCLVADRFQVDCPTDEGAPFTLSMQLTNQSGQTANWALLTPAEGITGIAPHQIPLGSGLDDGDSIELSSIQLIGGHSGETICFNITLLTVVNGELEECCTEKITIDLPECECVALELQQVECLEVSADGTATVEVCFQVTNLATEDLHHIFVLADPTTGLTATPPYLPLTPPLAPGATNTYCLKLEGAKPGVTLKLPLTFHNQDLEECCLRQLCFDVPQKEPQETFCCRLPEIAYCCPNEGVAQALMVLCNKTDADQELNWAVTGLPPTPDCPVVLDPLTDVSPSNGSVLVPAGDCIEIPFKIDCEKLQNSQTPCAWYGIAIENAATGEKILCRGRVERTDDPTLKQIHQGGNEPTQPFIVTGVIGRGAAIQLLAENHADAAVEAELFAVSEDNFLQFETVTGIIETQWNNIVRLNGGQSRRVNVRVTANKTIALDPSGLPEFTVVHFFWRYPDRRTVLAASVPVRLTAPTTNDRSQAQLRSVRAVQRDDGTAGVELECQLVSGKGVRLQVCEHLNLTDWRPVPFSVEGESSLRELLRSETDAAVRLFVPMSGNICFFRIVTEDEPAAR